MAELTGMDKFASISHFSWPNHEKLSFVEDENFSFLMVFVFLFLIYLQEEGEVLQRAKEAPCTCTVNTSTVAMALLELRYITQTLLQMLSEVLVFMERHNFK